MKLLDILSNAYVTLLYKWVICVWLTTVSSRSVPERSPLPPAPLQISQLIQKDLTLAPNLGQNATRIQVQLVRFENPKSLMYDGSFCDVASKCDPRIAVDLDIDAPHATWPGPRDAPQFQVLYEGANQDIFNIAQATSKDVCIGDHSTKKIGNLRVQVLDLDDVTQPDLINEFQCVFELKATAGAEESITPWSRVKRCRAQYADPDDFRLYFRHRMYGIPLDAQANCDETNRFVETERAAHNDADHVSST